jgi:transcriptional regulator
MARVDAGSFVDAWMDAYDKGGNQSDVARTLGCSAANVSNRAKKLREAGVDLPELQVVRGVKLDIESLNARLKARIG